MKRVMVVSMWPSTVAETHTCGSADKVAPQRYGAAMVQAGLQAGTFSMHVWLFFVFFFVDSPLSLIVSRLYVLHKQKASM